ncbi:hypothetical protein HDU76_006023, partial [Blyttiomyces sp. JEL0837]
MSDGGYRKPYVSTIPAPNHASRRWSCEQCRARKIKCGLDRPECSECLKRGLTCVYLGLPRRDGKIRVERRRKPPQSVAPDSQNGTGMESAVASDSNASASSSGTSKKPTKRKSKKVVTPSTTTTTTTTRTTPTPVGGDGIRLNQSRRGSESSSSLSASVTPTIGLTPTLGSVAVDLAMFQSLLEQTVPRTTTTASSIAGGSDHLSNDGQSRSGTRAVSESGSDHVGRDTGSKRLPVPELTKYFNKLSTFLIILLTSRMNAAFHKGLPNEASLVKLIAAMNVAEEFQPDESAAHNFSQHSSNWMHPADSAQSVRDTFKDFLRVERIFLCTVIHARTLIEGKYTSPFLLSTIICLAKLFNKGFENHERCLWYYEKSRVYAHESVESPNLEAVQALALLTISSAHLGKLSAAWQFQGMTCRMAEFLRLNIDPDELDPTLSPPEKETRRRCWWSCFILEKVLLGMSGRGMSPINFEDSRVNYMCPEEMWSSLDPSTVIMSVPFRPPLYQTPQNAVMRIVEIFSRVGTFIRRVRDPSPASSPKTARPHGTLPPVNSQLAAELESRAIEKELTEWLASLPHSYRLEVNDDWVNSNITVDQLPPSPVFLMHFIRHTVMTLLHRKRMLEHIRSRMKRMGDDEGGLNVNVNLNGNPGGFNQNRLSADDGGAGGGGEERESFEILRRSAEAIAMVNEKLLRMTPGSPIPLFPPFTVFMLMQQIFTIILLCAITCPTRGPNPDKSYFMKCFRWLHQLIATARTIGRYDSTSFSMSCVMDFIVVQAYRFLDTGSDPSVLIKLQLGLEEFAPRLGDQDLKMRKLFPQLVGSKPFRDFMRQLHLDTVDTINIAAGLYYGGEGDGVGFVGGGCTRRVGDGDQSTEEVEECAGLFASSRKVGAGVGWTGVGPKDAAAAGANVGNGCGGGGIGGVVNGMGSLTSPPVSARDCQGVGLLACASGVGGCSGSGCTGGEAGVYADMASLQSGVVSNALSPNALNPQQQQQQQQQQQYPHPPVPIVSSSMGAPILQTPTGIGNANANVNPFLIQTTAGPGAGPLPMTTPPLSAVGVLPQISIQQPSHQQQQQHHHQHQQIPMFPTHSIHQSQPQSQSLYPAPTQGMDQMRNLMEMEQALMSQFDSSLTSAGLAFGGFDPYNNSNSNNNSHNNPSGGVNRNGSGSLVGMGGMGGINLGVNVGGGGVMGGGMSGGDPSGSGFVSNNA